MIKPIIFLLPWQCTFLNLKFRNFWAAWIKELLPCGKGKENIGTICSLTPLPQFSYFRHLLSHLRGHLSETIYQWYIIFAFPSYLKSTFSINRNCGPVPQGATGNMKPLFFHNHISYRAWVLFVLASSFEYASQKK